MLDNYRFNTFVMRMLVYVVLVILLIVTIVPIWLLIVNATRSTTEIQQGISILPSTHLIENYRILLSKGLNIWQGFSNSLFVAAASTVITVYFSMLTAYGIVVYDFKGKELWIRAFLEFCGCVSHDPNAAFHYRVLSIHV